MPSDARRRHEFRRRVDGGFLRFLAISLLLGLCSLQIHHSTLLRLNIWNRTGGFLATRARERVDRTPPVSQRIVEQSHIPRDQAIANYRTRFETWRRQYDTVCMAPTMNASEHCGIHSMRQGQPLRYPDHAEEHFAELHLQLSEWGQHEAHIMHTAANYSGPWIENYWIDTYLSKALAGPCLYDTFGSYIPLFLPWVDLWVENKFRYPDGFVDTLMSALRPDVAYVTVSQGDMGISGYRELPMKKIPNVLVLSAGGYGHVPIPLLKQEESPSDESSIQPSERQNMFVYTGSLEHAPNNLRKKMHKALLASDLNYTHYYGNNWRRVMQSALFNLVPRGYGRSAYHLMETLQSNLVPIYVYSDEPWIPYQDVFNSIGYKTTFEELPTLAKRLTSLPSSTIAQIEEQIASLRKSHFSYAGAIHQIGLFLKYGSSVSDLRCQNLPRSPR